MSVHGRGSLQANTFPSGHVAGSLAVALELLSHVPPAGFLFLLLSIAIAAGAFLGRYHYGLDMVLGALLAASLLFTPQQPEPTTISPPGKPAPPALVPPPPPIL